LSKGIEWAYAWRLGEFHYEGKKEEAKYDLECDREAP
jgi:hypothetical protein